MIDFERIIDFESSQLKIAVESQLGGFAILSQSVPVRETLSDNTAWEGVVHIFKLVGHPNAELAYAWSAIEESGKRRFFAVLHAPPTTSPAAAVRAVFEKERETK